MRENGKLVVALTTMLALTACGSRVHGNVTAFAVPGTASSTNWTGFDSGWTGPFQLTTDPGNVTYQTVVANGALEWQEWGSITTLPHGATVRRKLTDALGQGQTFRFGLDAKAGAFKLGTISPANTMNDVGFQMGADVASYGLEDDTASSIDTGVPLVPIDVQITWKNTGALNYHGQITVIGNTTPSYTWDSKFTNITSGSDINGFEATNLGSPSNAFGLRYIEVGSGVLPDPATLVPEPELIALLPLAAIGLLTRKRR